VIIPAFNAQHYLGMTLASACAQTHTDLEIIVVDDGSTDATAEVAESAARADKRVRVIRQRNAGVAAARNRGLTEARGEYVAPLDADDLWHTQNLALQVEALRAAGPGTALSYAWYVVTDENEMVVNVSPPRFWTAKQQAFLSQIDGNFIGNASSTVMRRSALEAVGGYDPSYRARDAEGSEDHALYLSLAERWDFTVVPEYLIAYRRHKGNMSLDLARMTRAETLVVSDLFRRRPNLSWYRHGRGYAAVHQGALLGVLRSREWGKLVDVLVRSAREGGAWCVVDLIGRRLTRQVANHWLCKLRPDAHRMKINPPTLDAFWSVDGSDSKTSQAPLSQDDPLLERAASEDA
jgi:glycosyltransferase involved in cell wall biosynthesis